MDPRKKVLSLVEEFKAFALKGNVVDLAVAVVIGGAFNTIVQSLVANVIMPLVNLVLQTGQASYTEWKFNIGATEVPYGKLIGDVVNFLVIALVLFIVIRKFLGWVMTLRSAEAPPLPLTKDQELLTEIRDLLKEPAAAESVPAMPPPGPAPAPG
jgi:large conductance mechanosensitive channel